MSATLATNEEGELLNQLLQVKPVTASMIDSYNHTVNYLIPKIIESQRLTTLKGKVITFSNPFFTRPTTIDKNHNNQIVPLYPYEARIRGESYMAKIYVRLTFNESDKYGQLTPIEGQTIETYLGKIPVMIGSELDNLYGLSEKERAQKGEPEKDPQGYFIIHQERTLLNLERLRTNIPLMYEDRGQQVVRYTSKTLTDTTIVVVQEIKNCLDVSFSGMESKQHLNIFIVFFVLGLKQNTVQTTLQIMDSFITDADPARELRRKKELRQYLQETNSAFIEATHQGSPTVIANLVADKFRKMAFIKSADQLIQVEENVRSLLFKNIKYPPTRAGKTDAQFAQDVNGALSAKVRMLAYMCTKFIEFKNGYRELDDRDNWANKMIEDAGRHIEVRFNDILGTVMEMAQKKITKDKIEGIENVEMAIRTNLLGEQFQKSFTRGIWSNFKTQKPVVTVDILNRDTLLATYSQLKKINAPMNGKGMVKEKRMVHLSGWGYISPSSTPEGPQCIHYLTPIQMADGSSKPIGQLRDGDWIITVNPITYEKEPTQIYNHFVRMASAHNQGLFKITTLNGREIIATGDHPFLTQNGWVNAQNLDINVHKVIITSQTEIIQQNNTQNIIINETTFRSILELKNIKPALIEKYANELKTMQLLPLCTNDQRLPIIARIYGFEITDGSLTINEGSPACTFSFGTLYDAETFNNDLKLLKFAVNPIRYVVQTQTAPDGRSYTHHTYQTSKGGAFAALLLACGSSHGRRVIQETPPIPDFIMNGSKEIQREFLGGFQGGDGGSITAMKRPDKVKAFSFRFGLIRKTKTQEHLQSLWNMMNQYAQLLRNFGIDLISIQYAHYYDDRWLVTIDPSSSEENIIRYMSTIGYRYSMTKQSIAFYLAEFLRYKFIKINERENFKQYVLYLHHNRGIKQYEIARLLNVAPRLIGSVIEYHRESPNSKTLPNKNVLGLEQWQQLVPSCNDCIAVPIQKIERLTEDVLVSDFTTVSPHHSMISNGFVTHNCGIVKDSAQTTYLSLDRDDSYIHSLIVPFLKYTVSKDNSNSIFLNGVHLGYINSNYLQKEILTWRRQQRIPFDTGIFTDLMEDLWIYTTGGRMCRPVLIVETDENGFSMPVIDKLKLRGQSIQTLLEKGAMEYIDAAEQQNPRVIIASVKSKINNANSYLLTAYENLKYVNEQIQQIEADTKISESEKIKKRIVLDEEKKQFTDAYEKAFSEPKYTHMEIDPTVILGVRTALVPLPESMPGPRVTYQEGMYQQASGANSARDELRYDTTAKRLITTEVPFTATDMHERLGLDRYPAGMHVILMISTAFGYNQEDAIVMNKASIERGLFKHVIYHSYKVVIASNDEIRPPEKMNAYTSKLNEKGIIRIGETVVPGDMLVSKITKDNSDKKNIVIRDTSLYAEIGKKGVVDDILETMNTEEEGGILIRIRLREVREPIEGDKFASRYAQKGVIGKVVPEVDMPVIVSSDPYLNGVRPDIIFNPLGIPSRMTVPKLLEVILGKIIARTGVRINVTAFRKFNMISFMDKLHDLGMARTGNELFMNAKTGRPMEVQIFTGPVYYQQLRHMVRDKAQARGRGAVQYLTRQPTSGIRKIGGLRLGKMEVTALIEHGASQLIKERTSTSSDAYKFTICVPCGAFAIVQGLESKVECLLCKNCNPQNFRNITIPYSMKLLTNLLTIANIKVKYVVSP